MCFIILDFGGKRENTIEIQSIAVKILVKIYSIE